MKKLLFFTRNTALAILLLAVTVSFNPTQVTAEGSGDGDTLTQLSAIQTSIDTLETLVLALNGGNANSPMMSVVNDIQNRIVLMQALSINPNVTIEVIVKPGNMSTEAEVITKDGVKRLDFIFSSPDTDENLVNETLIRTANTLNLNLQLLEKGVAVVSTFSGLVVPTPLQGSLNITPGSIATTPARTALNSIMVTGNVYSNPAQVKAVVKFDSEIDSNGNQLSATTTTYNFTYDLSDPTNTLQMKLVLLNTYVSNDLYQKLRLDPDDINDRLVMSIKRFANANEVTNYVNANSIQATSLINDLGSYSVIEKIDISAGDGNNKLLIKVTTDQNESLTLTIREDNSYWWSSDDNNDYYEYVLTYKIHGVVAISEMDSQMSSNQVILGIKNHLDYAIDKIGVVFGVNDTVVRDNIASFIMNNGSYRDSVSNSYCKYANREKNIVNKIANFYLEDMQYSMPSTSLVNLMPTVKNTSNDDYWMSSCHIASGLFPNL